MPVGPQAQGFQGAKFSVNKFNKLEFIVQISPMIINPSKSMMY